MKGQQCHVILVCAVLFIGTLLLFGRALGFDFIDYDDPDYVTQNVHVQNGLTWGGVRWAFTTHDAGNWHPLTWFSHMLDWQLFGNDPRGHHATNIFLHALNAALAFLALRRLTGVFWLSAASAALFAWHPLRVESVVWIAERKDVLSGFFFLLTLLTYANYVGKSAVRNPQSKTLYGVMLLLFVLGLMSKPMLMTLPFVLVLLDFWPLQRFNGSTIQRRLVEKIPFFLLSASSCVITYLAQKKGGAVVETIAFASRLENAFVSFAGYLEKFFWPFNLAVSYPLPNHHSIATVIGSFLLASAVTGVAWCQRSRRPWLLAGWLWFVGMLVPVIGLVQVGLQAMADRYTYLPVLGLQFALLWTLREMILFWDMRQLGLATAVLVLAGCAARTWNQLAVWQNSRALYEHALAVTKNNYLAHSNLGTTLFNAGQAAGAEEHLRKAVGLKSDFVTGWFKLGIVLAKTGRTAEAIQCLQQVRRLNPDFPRAVEILNSLQASGGQAE